MFLVTLMSAKPLAMSLAINYLIVTISALEIVDGVVEGVFMCVVSRGVGALYHVVMNVIFHVLLLALPV